MRGWAVASLIALLAPAAWIASFEFPVGLNADRVDVRDGNVDFTSSRLACNYGEISFEYAKIRNSSPINRRIAKDGALPQGITFRREKWVYPPRSHVLGIAITHYPNPGRTIWVFFLPLWLFTLLGAIPLARRFARLWVARDRSKQLRCAACGYDMRSSPQRCPECGATPGQVTLAPDVGPAVVAVAKSSGTKCVALMAVYMTAVTFFAVWPTPTRSFLFDNVWTPLSLSYLYYGIALAILLCGTFHAAGYSRSFEGFFGCGALSSLLLAPLYVYIGLSHPVRVQLAAVIAGAVILGTIACAVAAVRWQAQDRPRHAKLGERRVKTLV
jgi:hypothetical protein